MTPAPCCQIQCVKKEMPKLFSVISHQNLPLIFQKCTNKTHPMNPSTTESHRCITSLPPLPAFGDAFFCFKKITFLFSRDTTVASWLLELMTQNSHCDSSLNLKHTEDFPLVPPTLTGIVPETSRKTLFGKDLLRN